MVLNKIKLMWDWINKISPDTKTLIIIILLALLYPKYSEIIRRGYTAKYKAELEDYSRKVSPLINSELNKVLCSDTSISNVLLLNYHNTKENPSGFSFLYISLLGESAKDILYGDEWKELEYITYIDEIDRIHNSKILAASDIMNLKINFPKFYKRLLASNATGTAIYPLTGIDRRLGLIIILYNNNNIPNYKRYWKTIAGSVSEISKLLDYWNMYDRFALITT